MVRRLSLLQILLLLAGTFIAWNSVIPAFRAFYSIHGTVFRFSNCLTPNPFTTPCFWGASGFALSFIWGTWLYIKNPPLSRLLFHQQRLKWFLIGATIFGWSNVAYEFGQYYLTDIPLVGCSAQPLSSPLQSACLQGSTLYALALVVTFLILKSSAVHKKT